jgi:hypothetical protein
MNAFPKSLRHGSGAELMLEPARLLLVFATAPKREVLEKGLEAVELSLEVAEEGTPQILGEMINHTDNRFWVHSSSSKTISEQGLRKIETTFGSNLSFVSAVYRFHGTTGRAGLVSPIANVVLIKLPISRAGHEHAGLTTAVGQFGLKEIPEKSTHLNGYRYFVISDPRKANAYQLYESLLAQVLGAVEVQLETMPMIIPITAVPNDPLFFRQWDMMKIDGPSAWDISTGTGAVICILDQGCDLGHPDLAFASPGINLGTMAPPGSPTGPHGTCCAGIAAAVVNDGIGVAGVAGDARILPVAFQNWTDVEVAAGISFAAANGARVISMSFGVYAPGDGFFPIGWNFGIIDPAIVNAVNVHQVVLCAATGNENTGTINRYPARHPLVIACGGSDQSDNRKRPASPDGECWGANYGPGTSVVAPAVLCTTTDIQGVAGYNSNGGPIFGPCVLYPVSGDPAGNYFFEFNGTSSATPHVAGFAALLASAYPWLTNLQIRSVIERTAAKVGTGAYAEVPGYPNGTRTAEMGYGRINLFHGLDFADVMIRDWSGDVGVEPSAPPGGDFWDFSDVVVRPEHDSLFMPNVPGLSSHIMEGRKNYVYVRVENLGPHAARNVVVHVRLTPNLGAPFVYPADWSAVDAMHVSPTPIHGSFVGIPAGGSVIARFALSEEQTETVSEWVEGLNAQPSLLAVVTADNDYAFAAAPGGPNLVMARNNLAQRNLSVVHRRREREEEADAAVQKQHDPLVELAINIRVRGRDVEVELPSRKRR